MICKEQEVPASCNGQGENVSPPPNAAPDNVKKNQSPSKGEERKKKERAGLPGLDEVCSLIFSTPIVTPISLGALKHLLDVIRLQAASIMQSNIETVKKSIKTQRERQREEALHEVAQELTKILAVQTKAGKVMEEGRAMLAAVYTHLGTAIKDGLSLITMGGNMLSLVRPSEPNWFTDIVMKEGAPMDGSMLCYRDGLEFATFYRYGIPFLTEVEVADPKKEKEGDHVEIDYATLTESELAKIIEHAYTIMGPQKTQQWPEASRAQAEEYDAMVRSVAEMKVKAVPTIPEEPILEVDELEKMLVDLEKDGKEQSEAAEPNPFKMKMLQYLAGTMKDLPVDALAHASDDEMLRMIHVHCKEKNMAPPAPGEPVLCHKHCQDPLEAMALEADDKSDEGIESDDASAGYKLFEIVDAEVTTPDSGIEEDKARPAAEKPDSQMHDDDMGNPVCESIEDMDDFDLSQVDGPGNEPPPRKRQSNHASSSATGQRESPVAGRDSPTVYMFTDPKIQGARSKGLTTHVHLKETPRTSEETYKRWMDLLTNPYEEGTLTSRKKRILQWEQEEQLVAIHKYLRLPSQDTSEEMKATRGALWSKITNPPRCMDCVEKHKYAEPCLGMPKSFNGYAANASACFYYYPPHAREAAAADEPCTKCRPYHGGEKAPSTNRLCLVLPVWDAGLLEILPHCGAWTPVTAYDEVEGKVNTTYLHHELVNNRHCFYLNRPQHAAPFDPVIRTIQSTMPRSQKLREVPEYDLLSEILDYQARILEEIMKSEEASKKRTTEDDEEALSGDAANVSGDPEFEKGASSPTMDICGEDELPDIEPCQEEPMPKAEPNALPMSEEMETEDPEMDLVTIEVITSTMASNAEVMDVASPTVSKPETVIFNDSEFACGWCRSMTHSWRTCKELTDVMNQLDLADKNIRQEEENAKVGLCHTPDESATGPLSLKTFRGIIKRRQRRRDSGTKEDLPKFLTRKVNGVPLIVQVAIEEQLSAIHALCVEPTERKELLPFDSPLVERLINPLLCMSCWDNHAVGDQCAKYKENTLYQRGEDPWFTVRVLYPLLAGNREGCTHAFADFRVLDGGYFEQAVKNSEQWSERCTLLRRTPINSRMIYTRPEADSKADFYVIHRETLSELRIPTAAKVVDQGRRPLWSCISQITASPLDLEHCMKKQLRSILQTSCLDEISNRRAKSLAAAIYSPYICLQCGSRHTDKEVCTWNIPLLQSGARFSRTIRVRNPMRVGLNSQILEMTDINGAEFATLPVDDKRPIASLTQEFEIIDGGAFAPLMRDRLSRNIIHRFSDEKGEKTAVMVMTRPNCFEVEVADSLTDLQLQWYRGTTCRASTIPQLDAIMPRTFMLLSRRLNEQKRRRRTFAQATRRVQPGNSDPRPRTQKPARDGWTTPEILNPDVLDLLSPLEPTELDVDEEDENVFPPPLPVKRKNKKLWVNVAAANRLRDAAIQTPAEAPLATPEPSDIAPTVPDWEGFHPLQNTQRYLLEGVNDVPRLDRLQQVARSMECSLPSRDLSVVQRRQVKRHVISERIRLEANQGRRHSARAVSKKAKMITHLPNLYTYPPEDVRGDIVIVPLGREIRTYVPSADFIDTPLIGPVTVDAVLHQQLNAIHELCRDVPLHEDRIERLRNMVTRPALCVHCLQDHQNVLPLCKTVKENSTITPVRRGLAPTKRHVRVTWCDSHYSLPKELCQGCQQGDCPVDGLHIDNRARLSVVFTLVDGGAIDRMMKTATHQESWRYRRQVDPNDGTAQNTVMSIRWHPHATYDFPLTSATVQPFETASATPTPSPPPQVSDSPASPPPEGSKEQQELELGVHLREIVDKMQIAPPKKDEHTDREVQLSLRADYADLSHQIEGRTSASEPIRFSITVREKDNNLTDKVNTEEVLEGKTATEPKTAKSTNTATTDSVRKVPEWYADPGLVDMYVQNEDMEKLIAIWKQKGVVQPTTLTNPGGLFNLRPENYHTTAILPSSRYCTACRHWHAMITGTCTMDQFLTFERSRATTDYTTLPAEIKLMILKDRFARFHKHAYQLDTPEAKRPRDPAYRRVFTSLWAELPLNARPSLFLDDLIDEAYSVPPGFTSCRRDDVTRWKAGPSTAYSPWDNPQRYSPSTFRPRGICSRRPTFQRQQTLNRVRRQSRPWPRPRFQSCGCWGQRRDVQPHGW